MAINRKDLCKQYASTEKNIEVPKHFMALSRTLLIALTIYVRIMLYLVFPIADICHQLTSLKALRNMSLT